VRNAVGREEAQKTQKSDKRAGLNLELESNGSPVKFPLILFATLVPSCG
jgi:hypothetical protein